MDNRTLYAIFVGLAVIMLAGQILSYAAEPYRHEALSWDNGDDTVGYSISSSTASDYRVVMIDTGSVSVPDKLLIYYDETYKAHLGQGYLGKLKDIMCSELDIRGVDYEIVDANDLLECIQKDISVDAQSFRLLFATGAIPNILYDCTKDSPLMKWLEQGGVLYWVNGVIGLNISSETGLTECEGYGQLFLGIPDSDISMGTQGNIYAKDESLHFDRLRDLDIIYNDCTYGLSTESMMGDYLSIGYTAKGFDSLVLSKYFNGEGTIVNFGGKVATNSAPIIAKVIASKITYDSEVVYSEGGHLNFSEVRGDITVDPTKNHVLYLWIGYPVQIYSRTFTYY